MADLTDMWPFRKRRTDLAPRLRMVRDDEPIGASVVLTDEEREEVESFYNQIHGMGSEGRRAYMMGPHKDVVASSWSAIALQRRAERLAKSIELGICRRDESRLHLTDNLLSAATKAYAIFPIPIHLYDLACAMELAGLHDDAKQGFGEFLRSQSGFEPDEVAETVVSRRDVRSAIAHARARVAGYRAAA